MKHRGLAALAGTGLFLCQAFRAALQAEEPASPALIYGMDIFVPGAGSLYTGHPVRAGFIAAGRTATIAFAEQSRRYAAAYRSAERAALTAELLYGPGFRYKNQYGSGYHNADDFRRQADRHIFYSSLSLTLHAVITTVSIFVLRSDLEEKAVKRAPVFDVSLLPEPGKRPSAAAAFSIRVSY